MSLFRIQHANEPKTAKALQWSDAMAAKGTVYVQCTIQPKLRIATTMELLEELMKGLRLLVGDGGKIDLMQTHRELSQEVRDADLDSLYWKMRRSVTIEDTEWRALCNKAIQVQVLRYVLFKRKLKLHLQKSEFEDVY